MNQKIAIRVSNKREFDALMKHYESKGWVNVLGGNPHNVKSDLYPVFVQYNNQFQGLEKLTCTEEISFAAFAQLTGIDVKDEIEVNLGAVKAIVDKQGKVHFTSVIGMLYGSELEAIYEAYQQLK